MLFYQSRTHEVDMPCSMHSDARALEVDIHQRPSRWSNELRRLERPTDVVDVISGQWLTKQILAARES